MVKPAAAPSLVVVTLRNNTIRIGVMIRDPAETLATSGIRTPCRSASLSSFQLAVAISSFRLEAPESAVLPRGGLLAIDDEADGGFVYV